MVTGSTSGTRVMGPYLSRIGTSAPTVVVHTDPACSVTFTSGGNPVESGSRSHHYFPLQARTGDIAYTVTAGDRPPAEGIARLGAANTTGVTFAVIGDAQNSTSPERRGKVLSVLVAHQPAFIIHTGDMLVGKPDAGNVFGDEWRLNFFAPMPGGQQAIPFLPVLGNIGRREEMLAALQQAGIDLVFCGHDHNYQRLKPLARKGVDARPVQIVITGLAGSNPYDAAEKAYTAKVVNRRDHYGLVRVSPEAIRVQAIASGGDVIDTFEIPFNNPSVPAFEVEEGIRGPVH